MVSGASRPLSRRSLLRRAVESSVIGSSPGDRYFAAGMRIAQICPYSLSVPGGVQGQVLGLGRALRSLGHETRVLAPCDGPPPDPMVTPLGASVPTATNGSMAPIAPDPACALRTIAALRNEQFDVLHLHEPIVPGPTLTALVTSDIPMIGTFHAAGTRTDYRVLPWVTRRVANKLSLRAAVSAAASATAERTLGGTYELMGNGIEVDRFAKGEAWPTEAPTIFFVGRHEPRKGLTVLLEAVDRLPQDIRCWVAGSGPQTTALRTATANDPRVEWLGRISDAEKASRLRGADVFVAPSLGGESFGVVLLEAMAAGTPVLATDLPGYANVARADIDALLFPAGDSTALAATLNRLLADQRLRRELAEAGRRRADSFSMISLAERYTHLYDRIAN